MHVWDAFLSDIFESKLLKFCLFSAGDECWERLQILLIPSVKQPLKLMQVRIRQVYISFITPGEMSNSLRNVRNVQDFLSALRESTRSHDLQVSREWGHEFTSASSSRLAQTFLCSFLSSSTPRYPTLYWLASLFLTLWIRVYYSDYCQAILRDGRGAAFVPSPASGELLPFGYQIIDITGHSDMWGEYRDLLVCKVSVTQHQSL